MSNFNHYIILTSIMLFAGFLGGYGNYLVLPKLKIEATDPEINENYKPKDGKSLLRRSIILGLIASFLVPLFLKTISSNLLDKPVVADPKDDYIFNANYLVLIGFCLLAALLSKQFIEGLYEKVMKAQADATKAVDKADEASKKAKNVEAALTEKDDENEPAKEVALNNFAPPEPTLEELILEAIANSKYIWRSASGIAKNIGLKKNDISLAIQNLVSDGKLEMKVNAEKQLRYKVRN